jgi:hypothetical protein
MSQKLFRDPLYDYIAIDTNKFPWILDLIDCPEVQRLRYINQLGLSQFTYLGSTHSRLSHSLGVFHLIGEWLDYLGQDYSTCFESEDKEALLAATLLHDIGHGPFSHTTESFFGEHEAQSVNIILNPETSVNKILTEVNAALPSKVAGLIGKKLPEGVPQPRLWQKALLSSQLDADRLDFLRRDSLFSGAEYGNFDWYRIIHTTRLKEYTGDVQKTDLFWPDKTKYAIEEYLFSRFYMYQSVYYHHTTRGFEKVLQKILERAKYLASQDNGFANQMFPSLKKFFLAEHTATLAEFLTLTDHILLAQVAEWKQAKDSILSDLSTKFFIRGDAGFKVAREFDFTRETPMITKISEKENAAKEYLQRSGLDPSYYLLTDEFDVSIYKPYVPEKEEMSPLNVIMLAEDSSGRNIQEISRVLTRLQSIAKEPHTARYYCPYEHKEEIAKILK